MLWKGFIICLILAIGQVLAFNSREIENLVLYDVKWPGPETDENSNDDEDYENVDIRTEFDEHFQCNIPNDSGTQNQTVYDGPTAIELLKPLLFSNYCSRKLSIFWNYEVCHGRYIRQYHEEHRNGQLDVTMEYMLAKADTTDLEHQIDELIKDELKRKQVSEHKQNYLKRKNVDGQQVAYVEIKMAMGDECDVTNLARSADILYFCNPHGRHDVYSVKEKHTCHYEVIVTTTYLCKHPEFNVITRKNSDITCRPINTHRKKPYNLSKMNAKSAEFQKNIVSQLEKNFKERKFIKLEKKFSHSLAEIEKTDSNNNIFRSREIKSDPEDVVKRFLTGNKCFEGGHNWWRFRICYGKKVEQFHYSEDEGRETDVILLGSYDESEQIKWLNQNPLKKPKPASDRKQLFYYYGNGEKCGDSGVKRSVEVRLICLDVDKLQVSSEGIILYLLEPIDCQYILTIESAQFCPYIRIANNRNGVIEVPNSLDGKI